MGFWDIFKKQTLSPLCEASFLEEKDRYPAAVVVAAWEQADKTGEFVGINT